MVVSCLRGHQVLIRSVLAGISHDMDTWEKRSADIDKLIEEWRARMSEGRSGHPSTTPLHEYIEDAERNPKNKVLLDDARARLKGLNLDGTKRRETVPSIERTEP